MERDGFHSTVGGIRTRAGWGGLTIGRIVVIQAGGAKPGFKLVSGGDDEAVPEEDFGGDGHVEEGEVRLVDAGRVKQFLEGADGGAIEVEDFVEWGHAVGDLSEPRASACRRLLQLAGPVRVEHGARVERVKGGEGFGFAVERGGSGWGGLRDGEVGWD